MAHGTVERIITPNPYKCNRLSAVRPFCLCSTLWNCQLDIEHDSTIPLRFDIYDGYGTTRRQKKRRKESKNKAVRLSGNFQILISDSILIGCWWKEVSPPHRSIRRLLSLIVLPASAISNHRCVCAYNTNWHRIGYWSTMASPLYQLAPPPLLMVDLQVPLEIGTTEMKVGCDSTIFIATRVVVYPITDRLDKI